MQPWPSPRTGVCKRQAASRGTEKQRGLRAPRNRVCLFGRKLLAARRGEVAPKQGPRLRPEKGMREGASPEWAEPGAAWLRAPAPTRGGAEQGGMHDAMR